MDLKEAYEVIKKEWHAAERKVKKLEKELEKFRKEGASDSRVQKLLSQIQGLNKKISQYKSLADRYQELYEIMKVYKDYSVLGHLDVINRYDLLGCYPFEKTEDIVAEILKLAIKDGKGIEVNTSSFRYGLPDLQPCRKILHLYKDLGGRILTIGSDAHYPNYVGAHIPEVMDILRDEIGFTEICTFDRMVPSFHKL